MRPEEIRKLAGGYATGTLTAEERRALLEAALSDQEIFNELAGEQAFKELLELPGAGRRLLEAVERKPSAVERAFAWTRRPVGWALAGGLAAAAVLITVFIRTPESPKRPEPVLVARRDAPREAALPEAPQPAAPARKKPRVLRSVPPSAVNRQEPGAPAIPLPQAAQPTVTFGQEADSAPAPKAEAREMKSAAADAMEAPAGRVGMSTTRAEFALAARASAIPYRLLRLGSGGIYEEVPSQTVFGKQDAVRVIFRPAGDGRLQVVESSAKLLLDTEATAGVQISLDVPAGESKLTGRFRSIPFEIQILRQP